MTLLELIEEADAVIADLEFATDIYLGRNEALARAAEWRRCVEVARASLEGPQ